MAENASEQIASKFVIEIEAHFELLLDFPLSGAARKRLAPGLRVTFHPSYAIYYLAQPDVLVPDVLVIVRVIHGSRDVAALGERGGFG